MAAGSMWWQSASTPLVKLNDASPAKRKRPGASARPLAGASPPHAAVAGSDQRKASPDPGSQWLLQERDVRRLLSVSKSTLQRMIQRGLFPPPRMLCRRLRVWRTEDVLAWLDAHYPAGFNGKGPGS
jgi:predicted DNA-binding transcriptional regulator AlpA